MKPTPPPNQPAAPSRRASNEAAIRRYCEAWSTGDVPTIIDCYHDDLVLHYFGRSPLAGEHRGKAAALAVLARVQQLTSRRLLEIHDVLVSENHAGVLTREQLERDDRRLETRRVLVYHIRDGKLVEGWIYDDDQRAVDELWS
jgi:uncharacterized protein